MVQKMKNEAMRKLYMYVYISLICPSIIQILPINLKQRVTVQEEVAIGREQVSQYASQQTSTAQDRRQQAIQKLRRDYCRTRPYSPNTAAQRVSSKPVYQQRGHDIMVWEGEEERPLAYDDDIIDSLVEPSVNGGDVSHQSEYQLLCPKCQKCYPVSSPCDFLEHTDVCGGTKMVK